MFLIESMIWRGMIWDYMKCSFMVNSDHQRITFQPPRHSSADICQAFHANFGDFSSLLHVYTKQPSKCFQILLVFLHKVITYLNWKIVPDFRSQFIHDSCKSRNVGENWCSADLYCFKYWIHDILLQNYIWINNNSRSMWLTYCSDFLKNTPRFGSVEQFQISTKFGHMC